MLTSAYLITITSAEVSSERVCSPSVTNFPSPWRTASSQPSIPLVNTHGLLEFTVSLTHLIPDSAPNLTIQYQGFLGTAAGGLVDDEAIPVNVIR